MKENKLNYKLINWAALMVLLYVTVTNIGTWFNILAKIVEVLLPFIIAFTVAYALTPIVHFLERKGLPKWASILIVVLLIAILLLFTIVELVPLAYSQMSSFDSNLSKGLKVICNKLNIDAASAEDKIASISKSIEGFLKEGTNSALNKSVSKLGSIIVGFVAAIYFLAYMDNIRSFLKKFFMSKSKRMFDYFKGLDFELGNYIKGLFTFMIIEFVEYTVLLKIVGHPNFLVLGLLAGLMTVVPYWGGIITNIVALLLASASGPYTFIGTLLIAAIVPQIDGYYTSPKVYGKTNNINPLITIMVVSIGGTLAGPIGIIASLPVYILIRSTYHFFRKDLKKAEKVVKTAVK